MKSNLAHGLAALTVPQSVSHGVPLGTTAYVALSVLPTKAPKMDTRVIPPLAPTKLKESPKETPAIWSAPKHGLPCKAAVPRSAEPLWEILTTKTPPWLTRLLAHTPDQFPEKCPKPTAGTGRRQMSRTMPSTALAKATAITPF